MQITLLSAIDHKPTLANLMQLYLYDRSEIARDDVDDQGRFSYPCFDCYWIEADRHPFLITVDERPAGFALVSRNSRLRMPFEGHVVGEFFVMRKYRYVGVGRAAAIQLFDRFPGPWEVASPAINVPAQAFWRSVIQQYTGGHYTESWLQNATWRGPVQLFTAGMKRET